MKPFSILLSIVLGFAALSFVVWIGRFGGAVPSVSTVPEKKPIPTLEDLPMPKSGPFGKAEIAEDEFDFGAKNVGDDDKHTFTIKNTGEGVLQFKLGKPTCQCTVGEITKEDGEVLQTEEGSIKPGESVNILVKWVMKAAMVKFRQVVPVFTTDPDKRKIELVVTGSVDSLFHLMPEGVWDLGEMSAIAPSTATGNFVSTVIDQFTLAEEPRENARVKVTIEPADIASMAAHHVKSGYSIKMTVGPDVPVGTFRESIKFKATSDRGESVSEVTVTGRRAGPIDIRGVIGAGLNVTTNRLVFSDFPASKGKKATLTLFVKGFDDDLVLNSVEPADTPIKVKFPESPKLVGKSKSYQIEIEIPPGPAGKHRAEDADVLSLKLNHPEVPELKLLIDYNAVR